VTATACDVLSSDDAVLTAKPVVACTANGNGMVPFGPNAEYGECSITACPCDLAFAGFGDGPPVECVAAARCSETETGLRQLRRGDKGE